MKVAHINGGLHLDKPISHFTVSGDPGCDGYNVESVSVLEAIVGQPADFHFILGDLVPIGQEHWLKQFEQIVESASVAPTYCLLGNHDLPNYEKHFGSVDYYITAENALIVVLDNAARAFRDDSVRFLRDTLAKYGAAAETIFVALHMPPPNAFSPNSIPETEWTKVKSLLEPFKAKIAAIFAGHVHSAFSFSVDGFPVIVTGGGGARLDPVPNTYFSANRHHVIQARLENGTWGFHGEEVLAGAEDRHASDPNGERVREALEESFSGECEAIRRYALFSERANALGQPGLAKLFRAAADSEKYHASNMLVALGGIGDNATNLEQSIRRESAEWQVDYANHLREAETASGSRQAATAFDCAIKAEKIHDALFREAFETLQRGDAVPDHRYFTCARCGFTHRGDAPPRICPACGTDNERFVEVL